MGIKIYADGASLDLMSKYADDPTIEGFTTNPSLMRKSGIKDYKTFAKEVLEVIKDKPVSFEVTADDWIGMERQANEIQSWGSNVWVKIPITNTHGESSMEFIEQHSSLQLNVTAVMTVQQIECMLPIMHNKMILSIFVGRIQDTFRLSPSFKNRKHAGQILWASTRRVCDIQEAKYKGYDIITMTTDLIDKLPLEGKDLSDYSLDTVKMFHRDGMGLVI